MGRFKNKVVIVTGASSGIGEATAIDFAKEGANLVITGRNKERLSAAATKCKESGSEIEVHEFIGNLGDFKNLELLISETVTKFGSIDILVNNAGFGDTKAIELRGTVSPSSSAYHERSNREDLTHHNQSATAKKGRIRESQYATEKLTSSHSFDNSLYHPITDVFTKQLEEKTFTKMFNANVRAPVFLSKYALPYLKKSKGCVVNVSSCASLTASPGSVAYSMTKAALDHFTRGFSSECASYGVRVNCINPAVVTTRFAENLGLPEDQIKQAMNHFKKAQPLGFINSHQVSDGILYLCSSEMTTGITLAIDGGFLHSSKMD